RRDDGVERGVPEWKALGRGPYDVSLHGRARELPLESPCHRLLGLDEDDLLDTTVEVGKVRAGAAADLEHSSARLREQLLAVPRQPRFLCPGRHRVVHRGKQPASEAHGRTVYRLPPLHNDGEPSRDGEIRTRDLLAPSQAR